MSKITIYELLGRLRKGENPPKRIESRLGITYTYSFQNNDYIADELGDYLFKNLMRFRDKCLDDTVEIIEEVQKIERIKKLNVDDTFSPTDIQVVYDIRTLKNKINAITDKVNELEKTKPTIIDGSKIQLCGYNTSDQVDY